MASRGTSRVNGRSSGKLLPKAEGRGQQFPIASPLTEGQMLDCSSRSHGISVYCMIILLKKTNKRLVYESRLVSFTTHNYRN